jgi:PhnB protein
MNTHESWERRKEISMEPTRTPKLAVYLVTRDPAGLIRFIEEGIGGTPGFREVDADGRIAHAEMRIADSVVMLADIPPGRPAFPAMLHLYVDDADRAHARAIRAGATSVREPADQSDGDRRGGVKDPFGNEWWFTRARP